MPPERQPFCGCQSCCNASLFIQLNRPFGQNKSKNSFCAQNSPVFHAISARKQLDWATNKLFLQIRPKIRQKFGRKGRKMPFCAQFIRIHYKIIPFTAFSGCFLGEISSFSCSAPKPPFQGPISGFKKLNFPHPGTSQAPQIHPRLQSGSSQAPTTHFFYFSSSFSTLMKAFCGISTLPTWRIRFLPSFCFSRSFFLRLMSPP